MKLFTFTLALAVGALAGCKSSGVETHDAGRWKAYSGCNETQCRSWNSGCQAECMDAGRKTDADVCMNQCRVHFDDCVKSCAG